MTDISPVRALAGLKNLLCTGIGGKSKFSDLSPLQGMNLTNLQCWGTAIADLSPLKGMKLTSLGCQSTQVSDLSPLKGMTLTGLRCYKTQVSDLSPIEELHKSEPLQIVTKTKVTPASVAALQKALPNCKIEWDGATSASPAGEGAKAATTQPNQPWNTPAFQAWMKEVQAMPAEQQVEAVSKKLMELNPGFDGEVTGGYGTGTPKIEAGVVTELGFVTDKMLDISPVKALVGLRNLWCSTQNQSKSKLSDLSPLTGMQLTYLNFGFTQVSSLQSLQGMPLKKLSLDVHVGIRPDAIEGNADGASSSLLLSNLRSLAT